MEKREIKFRGIELDKNCWVYGYVAFDSKKENAVIIHKQSNNEMQHTGVNPETIGEYTGLKDKNGKEIYEGDYLFVCAGYSSRVEFKDGMFVSVYTHPEDGETIPLCDIIGKDTEIIEEFKNPELLKQK